MQQITQDLRSQASKLGEKLKRPSILAVYATYYHDLAAELLADSEALHNEESINLERCPVPGALEIATAISMAHKTRRYDGYLAVGVVVRGETSHYDIVANHSAWALSRLGLDGLCIGNAILTTDNLDQAWARADRARGNKGLHGLYAAMRLIEWHHNCQ